LEAILLKRDLEQEAVGTVRDTEEEGLVRVAKLTVQFIAPWSLVAVVGIAGGQEVPEVDSSFGKLGNDLS